MSNSEEMSRRFTGKVAIVTGGASGIGEAVVRRLVAEGASVVVGDLDADGLRAVEREHGGAVTTRVGDVSAESTAEDLVAAAVETYGRLDVAVNNAGAMKRAPITEVTEAAWDFTLDVCLKGVFFGMKHQARQLIKQGDGGAIVNVASLSSRIPAFGDTPYSVAKAGVAMLTESGALEWGEHGIRVNAVSPGYIITPLSAALREIEGATEAWLERIPMKTLGTPENVADPVAFLASSEAGYISGTNLMIDGAWATSTYPDIRPFLTRMAGGTG